MKEIIRKARKGGSGNETNSEINISHLNPIKSNIAAKYSNDVKTPSFKSIIGSIKIHYWKISGTRDTIKQANQTCRLQSNIY